MKKVLFTGLLCCLCTVATMAVPAYPYPVPYTLEDGTVIMAQIHGDEYFSYVTDMQGNVIRGYKPSAVDSVVINAARRARQQEMIGSGFPLTGSPRTLAILVEFKDLKFTKKKEDFENLLMQSGYKENGATGSCRDYFIACSDSVFTPQIDVYGPYQVDDSVKYSSKNKEAIFKAALQLAVEDGLDFSKYDMDGNNRVDNVFFYYAGHNSAEGGPEYTIWPHASKFINFHIQQKGKDFQIESYACTSELKSNSGNTMCAIGTFCHEFGHVLGLPDWYNTSGDSDDKQDHDGASYTIGTWSIMSAGNYNNGSRTPPSYNAYERFYLGWLTPKQLTEPHQYFLEPLTESNSAYLITADNQPHNLVGKGPSPSEFFMLEYRTATGWDAPKGALPGTGMLVWHIDYKASTWAANTPNNSDPMGLHLEEAGGRKGTSMSTDPYPGKSSITNLTLQLHDKTLLASQPIYNITEVGGKIGFIYTNVGVENVKVQPKEMTKCVHLTDKIGSKKSVPTDWKVDSIIITGVSLDLEENFEISTPSTSQFYISVDPNAKNDKDGNPKRNRWWQHTIQLNNCVQTDSTFNQVVYVNYYPEKQSCEEEITSITIQSQTNWLIVPVTGTAPRPILIKTPTIREITNITPYSFDVTWKADADAENYFVTLYSMKDGKTELKQSFENFKDKAKIQTEGWRMTDGVATTAAVTGDGKLSLLLRETGDSIISESYPAPIQKISFWVSTLSTLASPSDTIGTLKLEASNNGITWTKVKTFTLLKSTKSKTYTEELDVKKQYCQFRFIYTDCGGSGTAFDAFTAIASKEITYVFKGKQKTIVAEEDVKEQTETLSELAPGTEYYFQLQCGENKGCEEHLSDKSIVKKVPTRLDNLTLKTKEDIKIDDPIKYNRLVHIIYLPEVLDGYTLFVYDLEGHLVWNSTDGDVNIKGGDGFIQLPSEYFIKGKMYAAKYMNTDKMTRKDQWIKFMY